jgi:hypothetical protein
MKEYIINFVLKHDKLTAAVLGLVTGIVLFCIVNQ